MSSNSDRATALPIVMLHGASSNLEVMRPLAERLSQTHRVILVDRPGHGWSTRANFSDSTPQPQARMISEALEKLGVGKRDRRRAFLERRAWPCASRSIIPTASPAS